MQVSLGRLRKKLAQDDKGFTLIELLVVVVIIGVLVAIAIPTYLNYTKGAKNKSAQSDVRGAVSAVEQYYTENGNAYPDDVATTTATVGQNLNLATTGAAAGEATQTITVSDGNWITYNKVDNTHYNICAQNQDGKAIYFYNSAKGGAVKKWTTDASLTNCANQT
jgi:type IV pilus assembly protein PilA